MALRSHLKLSQIAQNKYFGVLRPVNQYHRPKQPQQKANRQTKKRVLPPWRPFRAQSHLRLSLFAKNNPNKQKINKQTEHYWQNAPAGRAGSAATSDSVCSPTTTPTNKQKGGGWGGGRVLPAKSSWRPIRTRSHLELSLFAQNNPNKRQTNYKK